MRTILLVDDEESIRWSFMVMLQKAGYRVFTAGDYASALDLLEQIDADLVISDILLPGRSGLDILQWLKKRGRSMPVVLITGQPDMESVERSCKLGAFDYLAKPLRKDNLLHVVERGLQQRDLMHDQALLSLKDQAADGELPPHASALQTARALFDRELLSRLRAHQQSDYQARELAALFHDSPLAVAFTDGETVAYLNPSFQRLTGYDIQDMPDIHRAFELLYPDPELRNQVLQTRAMGHRDYNTLESEPVFQQFTITTKDGQKKPLAMCGVFLGDKALYSLIEV